MRVTFKVALFSLYSGRTAVNRPAEESHQPLNLIPIEKSLDIAFLEFVALWRTLDSSISRVSLGWKRLQKVH